MSDVNEFTDAAVVRAEPCEFVRAIDGLDAAVQERLHAALALPVKEARNITIAARLRDSYGVQVTWQKVRSHRSGLCSCG